MYYHWDGGGVNASLSDVLTSSNGMNLSDGEAIDLLADVTLDGDLSVIMGGEVGSVLLTMGQYSVTGGKLLLPAGASIICDQAADALFAPAEGCVLDKAANQDGTYTYSSISNENVVASIGTKYYASLAEAMKAAKTGDTVQLLKDVTLEKAVEAGGKTVSGITL